MQGRTIYAKTIWKGASFPVYTVRFKGERCLNSDRLKGRRKVVTRQCRRKLKVELNKLLNEL